jgi:hypothetical protein
MAMTVPIQIDGLPGWWQEVTQRYDYTTHGVHCPVCGEVGWRWHGWYTCDGTCHAVAVIATGQVFVPVPASQEPLEPQTYAWEP